MDIVRTTMNTITITGGTVRKRELAQTMTDFVLKKLLPRYRTLDIKIVLKKLPDGLHGLCTADTKREFEIEINSSLKLREMMIAVAHELVHVKQFASGELDAYNFQPSVAKQIMWKGSSIKTKGLDYWDQPWEIEAHGRESGLFIQWARAHGKNHRPGKWMEF